MQKDHISEEILKILARSNEPLETKEIEDKLKEKIKDTAITRTKVFYRLTIMRGDGKLKGKFTGPGKGVWVWWRITAFKK